MEIGSASVVTDYGGGGVGVVGVVGASYSCYDIGMSRTAPIRLTQSAEADLVIIGALLRGDRPIPTTRANALRYALAFARTYMEGCATAGQALPSIEQLEGSPHTRG